MAGRCIAQYALICGLVAAHGYLPSLLAQSSRGDRAQDSRTLTLLASKFYRPGDVVPVADATAAEVPTVLFSVAPTGQLDLKAVVLQGKVVCGNQYCTPEGPLSIHEVGAYLIIAYPDDLTCCAIFLSEESPQSFQSENIVPSGFVAPHPYTAEGDGAASCSLWLLVPNSPPAFEDGKPILPHPALRSACTQSGAPLIIEDGKWDQFKRPRFDGASPDEGWIVSIRSGQIVQMNLAGPAVTIGDAPPAYRAIAGIRAAYLEAASERYLVIGVMEKDHPAVSNKDVFVRTAGDSKWERLPVLPVAQTSHDRLYYRLFDNWLVTSASASLLAANHIAEGNVVPDFLTLVSTGKQWADWGIKAESRTTPDVANLPARRITLWNLADGRRVDLAIQEDDSEVVHIFDDHQVLMRFHDKLFFAEIQGTKLTGYRLVAFDSAIPMVHWAWYSHDHEHEH